MALRLVCAVALCVLLIPSGAFTAGAAQQTQSQTADSNAASTQPADSDAAASSASSDSAAAAASSDSSQNTGETAHADASANHDDEAVVASTVEDDGVYSVTVNYVDSQGTALAPSFETVCSKGESWRAASPDIDGYALDDSSQAVLTGTAQGSDHFQTYTVRYVDQRADYTIIYMKQADEGVYYEADRETETGTVGSTVTVTPKSYSGFHCITDDRSVRIAADGKSTIELYYDQDERIYTLHFYTQGTYVPFVSGAAGTAITAPSDPTRLGYAFAGWDIDGDGVADALPSTMPAHNVYAVALWTPSTTNYVINYWKESKQDNGTYQLAETSQATGTTGQTTPTAPLKDTTKTSTDGYKWYLYSHEDSVVIAADGTSVLNVYYDLKTITLSESVQTPDGAIEVVNKEVKFGHSETFIDQETVQQTYALHGGTDPNFIGWVCTKNGYGFPNVECNETSVDFDTLEANFLARFTSEDVYRYDVWSYYQALDGSYSASPEIYTTYRNSLNVSVTNNDEQAFSVASYRMGTGPFDGTNYDGLTWTDWKDASGPLSFTLSGKTSNIAEVRYSRSSFNVHYYSSGVEVKSVSHLYEQQFDPDSDIDSSSLTPPAEGYTFAGWYDNESFEGSPVTSLTMPAADTNLYAKWVRNSVTVTFDSNGGTPVASQSVAWGGTASQPANPTKASGVEFLGWYEYDANGVPSQFEFDRPLEADATLVALWNPPADSVGCTVVHKTVLGTVLKTEQVQGWVGQTRTFEALDASDPARAGWQYVDASLKNITLSGDASSNVVTFVYSQQPIHQYTVHYVDRDTGQRLLSDSTLSSADPLVSVNAAEIEGYSAEDPEGYVSIDGPEWTFYYQRSTPVEPSGGADVVLDKTADNLSPAADDFITYTIVVSNQGDADAVGVWVKDYVPDGTSFIACDSSGAYGATLAGREYASWFIDTLAPGETQTLTMKVRVNGCNPGTPIANTALFQVTGSHDRPDFNDDPQGGGTSNGVSSTVASGTRAATSPRTSDVGWASTAAACALAAGAALLSFSRKRTSKRK